MGRLVARPVSVHRIGCQSFRFYVHIVCIPEPCTLCIPTPVWLFLAGSVCTTQLSIDRLWLSLVLIPAHVLACLLAALCIAPPEEASGDGRGLKDHQAWSKPKAVLCCCMGADMVYVGLLVSHGLPLAHCCFGTALLLEPFTGCPF